MKMQDILDAARALRVICDEDLRGMDFCGVDPSLMRFKRCNLAGARFQGLDLSKTGFFNCDLSGADFPEPGLWATCGAP